MKLAYEFVMPPEVARDGEGFVVNWFKDAGQSLRAGELLLEVQFEKTAIELDAPVDGVLGEIATARGETVKAGQLLCRIIESGTQPAAALGEGDPTESSSTRPASDAEAERAVITAAAGSRPAAPTRPQPRPGATAVRATPAARRVAREHDVDLGLVTGTGPGGRISEEDVRTYLAGNETDSAVSTPTIPSPPAGWQQQRLTPAQRTTGRLMLTSLQQTAQYTLTRHVDVTAVGQWRTEEGIGGEQTSWTDLFHRAVIAALSDMPIMQAQLKDDELWFPDGVDLSFAVARDDDLFAPVIRQAHRLNLVGLRRERERLTEAARTGRLAPDELQGGTFTVTNLGPMGIDHFTPVLNPPQPAILGLGRIVRRPVFRDESVQAALETTLSLTLDHRTINGATGARFLERLAELLEQPGAWLDEP